MRQGQCRQTQCRHRIGWGVEQEGDLVAELRGRSAGRLGSASSGSVSPPLVDWFWDSKRAGIASADGCAQRIEQYAESCAARVDDAAGREHIELPPRAEQGFAGREGCFPADLRQVSRLGSGACRRLGGRVCDGQHRTFHRPVHRGPRQRGGLRQRERDHLTVARRCRTAGVGEAAEQLAEDDARVPACTLQGRGGGGLPDLDGACLFWQADDRLGRARDRPGHVGARVGVSDGEYVECVDRRACTVELVGREPQP